MWRLVCIGLGVSVTVAAALVVLTSFGVVDGEWWKAATESAPATLLGIVLGVPFALSINRHQQEASAKAAEAERLRAQKEAADKSALQAVEKETKVMSLLRGYVETCAALTKLLQDHLNEANGTVPLDGFITEQWEVLKATGELSAVRDLDLLVALGHWHGFHLGFNGMLQRLIDNIYFYGVEVARDGQPTARQANRAELYRVTLRQLEVIAANDAQLMVHLGIPAHSTATPTT
jgi:hypothetical protein